MTGHRDIREQDSEELKRAIRDILVGIKNKYGSTPLILLSALAEGADRLAAHVALSPEIQARLFVPLPMPQSAYEQDFRDDSLAEFRALLGRAQGSLQLPLAEGNSIESILHQGPQRDRQYESVGKYIVQKSQILIALWDGIETGLVGGTASVVKFQKEGLPLSEPCSLEALEGFPVFWVVTPRLKNPNPQGTPFQRRILYPDSFGGEEERARKYYDRMFSRIDEFNRYAAHPSSVRCREIEKSKGYLLQDLNELQLSRELRAELNRYGLADALAMRFHREKVFTDRLLHAAVFLAFLSFAFFAHVSQHPVLLALSLGLLLLGGVWRGAFRRRNGDTKPEDYRAMAEGLRVRFFWKWVGLPDSVADHYLGKQRSELDWIRNGFRGWDIRSDSAGVDTGEALIGRIEKARLLWVEDQQSYFHRAAKRDERRLALLEFLGNTLAYFAVAVAATLFAVVFFRSLPKLLGHGFFGDYIYDVAWWVIVIEACLAGAALLHNYGNGMAYREHAKQYARMEGVFSRAGKLLKDSLKASDSTTALRCIKKLGKEALTENGDWVLLHRERPLDVPHP